MVSVFNEVLTKASVVESPRDVILDGVIISIEKGLLREFLDESVYSKFDNLDQETLKITYECQYNNKSLLGNDKIAYYSSPGSNSKLGKFLTKYSELKVGLLIKVEYDGEGFGKIKVK